MQPWLAAYLYYAEPWTDFLLNAVQPFIRETMTFPGVEQYFFIRYWERGPHIRLRFKGDADVLAQTVKPRLLAHFTDYMQQHPSERFTPEWETTLPEGDRWFPNNSVQWIDYEPETERYGGDVGILIAERHFQDSSETILRIMRESASYTYERALGAAIQMHLAFAHAMRMNLATAQEFYRSIFYGWLPSAYGGYRPDITPEQRQEAQNAVLKAFEEQFEKQKPMLLPFHQTVWDALQEGVEFEQEWLNSWIQGVQRTASEFYAATERGEIIDPMQSTSPEVQQNIFGKTILGSYVHMTNNRLGIQNRDEGYLGYLIMRSMEAL
jgi:thiopeptide-type bacteriocin biosynthesis protein